ncbi:HEAT repeat domain-containing protein [Terrimonas sp. NA20]|uniref:HEAT repeat domain-containing protein n=1 Tax=Terrimonas ginsenosidimutans TaxID=2908004 RepID=A0ABS9KUP6_9BACT|nr:HEAT repeat domain-containing protein [Terrimonas ginsenosidimutans]MCG2616031.1 HEAT repeat domain-containing protein [Terrimonas ginsenosidimutans]
MSPLNYFLYTVGPFQFVELMYLFISIIVLVVGFIAFYLFYRARRTARKMQLRLLYSEHISMLAICEGEQELQETIYDIHAQLKQQGLTEDEQGRGVLIKELVTAAKSMSGAAKENISAFYRAAGLDQITLSQLKSGAWHVKSRSIQTLSHLGQKQHIAKIYRHTNNRNELIRSEARVAVVKLTGFQGLRFLDVITYPLTEWEQLCLVHELSENHLPDFKHIPDWLHSDNDSVVEFALRLVESYRILELHGDVAFCLAHGQSSIRKKAVQAVRSINQPQTAPLLATQLLREEEDVQLVVLEAMGEVGSENDLAVLWPFLAHPRTVFKIAAARAIRNSHPYGMAMLRQRVDMEVHPWYILIPQLEEEVNA